MEFSADKPINTSEQDLLGRASFSKQLGRAIYEYSSKEGLVIGLYGKWGTGKTSVINMAVNEIDNLAKYDAKKPIVMRFAPWNYSDKDDLISLFFNSLKIEIDIQDDEKFKKKVGQALSDYADVFDALSLLHIVSPGLVKLLKTVAKVNGSKLAKANDLNKTREKIDKALSEEEKKIIIVIDDIDRLTNSQIRDIFQLVKQVADFPNVIYLLAMDREIVRSALSEVHNIDGDEYLEKIIQVSFVVPTLRKTKLNEIFLDKLDKSIRKLPDEIKWDENYWNDVFENCISPYINTIRDVYRVINTFMFRYEMLYQETSFEDMISTATLEVLEPQLYRWIANNKEALCGGLTHELSTINEKKTNYRELYYSEFEQLGLNPEQSLKCVSTMFPVFSKDINDYQYKVQSKQELRGKMRVADESRFELYFELDLEKIEISRSTIRACINYLNEDELYKVITQAINNDSLGYLIEEIKSMVYDIPYNRLQMLARALLNFQNEYKGETLKGLFTINISDMVEYLTTDIIARLDTEEEKYQVILSTVEKANKARIGMIASIINRIELSYGRLASNTEDENKQIVSLKHLEILEEKYVERVKEFANSKDFLEIKRFNLVFYLWECFDEKNASSYLAGILKNDVNKLKYICAMAGRWNGTNGIGWGFNSNDYSKYISNEEAYESILAFDKSKIGSFNEIEQIKLATFVLNYNNDDTRYVNESEARKLVNKWKAETEITI